MPDKMETVLGFNIMQYNINNVGWHINCAACCWTYLTRVRHYAIAQGDDNQVRFRQVHNLVRCFIAPATPGNVNGQFKTDLDPHLGNPVPGLLVRDYSTFRFYSNQPIPAPEQIAIGEPVTARIESIAIQHVRDEKINGSWLCYNHAALCELFRGTEGLAPLLGVCVAGQQVAMFKSEVYVPSDDIKGAKESPIKREKEDDVDKLTEGMKKLASH